MEGIGERVYEMSKAASGPYWKIHSTLGISKTQDIELMISLLVGYGHSNPPGFEDARNELKTLFRRYLLQQIVGQGVQPSISRALMLMHRDHANEMGEHGEHLIGVLTINYDSVLDQAFWWVHGGLNCGVDFHSTGYPTGYPASPDAPFLLKLHGSFNWRVTNDRLGIENNYEQVDSDDDFSGWIPPSVYKMPSEAVSLAIWARAANLLSECHVLRVVGSSLRTEDFPLLSLLVSSQFRCPSPFGIELIVPDKYAQGEEEGEEDIPDSATPSGENRPRGGMMGRVRFLGNLIPISELPAFRKELYAEDNVFRSWVLMKWKEIKENATALGEEISDPFIEELLRLED